MTLLTKHSCLSLDKGALAQVWLLSAGMGLHGRDGRPDRRELGVGGLHSVRGVAGVASGSLSSWRP